MIGLKYLLNIKIIIWYKNTSSGYFILTNKQ